MTSVVISEDMRTLYLDLLKKCLTGSISRYSVRTIEFKKRTLKRMLYQPVSKLLALKNVELVLRKPFSLETSGNSKVWPNWAETMVGLERLDNLQSHITDVLREGVPGDFIETGVWRGGTCIFMRAVLKAYGDVTRRVWVADSFQGLPKPDTERFPVDLSVDFWDNPVLAVPIEEVKSNFEKYGMLDERVRFLRGWFRDTLPTAPIDKLAILRLDGDLYESTMDSLMYLYPKLSVRGYVIVDDYGVIAGCKEAVDNFRESHRIKEKINWVDEDIPTCIFWKKES